MRLTYEQTLDRMALEAGPLVALVYVATADGGHAYRRQPWPGRSRVERDEALYWSTCGGGQVPMATEWTECEP